jgi:hypothetical protein
LTDDYYRISQEQVQEIQEKQFKKVLDTILFTMKFWLDDESQFFEKLFILKNQ